MRIHSDFCSFVLAFLLASLVMFFASALWPRLNLALFGILTPLLLALVVRWEEFTVTALGLAVGTAFGLFVLPYFVL